MKRWMKPIIRIGIAVLVFCQNLYGIEVLERRIDVHFQQMPLKEALTQVARQGHFEWSYNSSIINANRLVTLDANDWTVREILYTLLGDGYQFKPSGNYVILKKQSRPPDRLSGYLKDPKTGQRLANATVYDRKTMRATTTDSNGYYALRRTKRNTELVVSRLGYRDTILQVSSMTPQLQQISLTFNAAPPTYTPSLEMELRGMARAVERFLVAEAQKWRHRNVPDSLRRNMQVSFLPFVGSNRSLSGKVTNNFSFNIIAGYSKGVQMLEVGGVANFARSEVNGIQVAGAVNGVGDTLQGMQVAGVLNVAVRTDNAVAQLAGLLNTAGQGDIYIQAAGILNVADTVRVIQAAGLVNVARRTGIAQLGGAANYAKTGQGLQASALLNITNDFEGIQVTGLVNRADDITGIQLAGLVNRANDFDGIQVSGLVNRAKRLRGIQIGLINSARRGAGVQIGLLNRSGKRVLPFFNVVTTPRKEWEKNLQN
jgi:CarboxypepD_reg-like domain